MARKLLSTLRGICLACALGSVGLWARSHWVADEYNWPVPPDSAASSLVHTRAVFTTPGRIAFNERCAFT
jgi:hypothetical protein